MHLAGAGYGGETLAHQRVIWTAACELGFLLAEGGNRGDLAALHNDIAEYRYLEGQLVLVGRRHGLSQVRKLAVATDKDDDLRYLLERFDARKRKAVAAGDTWTRPSEREHWSGVPESKVREKGIDFIENELLAKLDDDKDDSQIRRTKDAAQYRLASKALHNDPAVYALMPRDAYGPRLGPDHDEDSTLHLLLLVYAGFSLMLCLGRFLGGEHWELAKALEQETIAFFEAHDVGPGYSELLDEDS